MPVLLVSDHPTPQAEEKAPVASRLAALATSAGGIYGLIVVSGVIAVSRNLTASSAEALLGVAAALLVIFAAHTYAAALAHLAESARGERSLLEALRHGILDSTGMLLVGVIPIAVLSLGVIGILAPTDAVWLALMVDVLLLGILGWAVTAARVRGMWARLGGALVTTAFGAVIIALKALIH